MSGFSMPDGGRERRRDRRISIAVEAIATVNDLPPSTKQLYRVRALAIDISVSGLQIRTRHLGIHEALILSEHEYPILSEVELPYLTESIVLPGRIMWAECRRQPGERELACSIGVLFDRLSPQSKEKLEYVMNRIDNDSYDAVPLKGVRLRK